MGKKLSKTTIDITVIAGILPISFYFFGKFDVLEKVVDFSSQYECYEIDEILSTFILSVFCMAWFSIRRWREAAKITDIVQKKTKKFKRRLVKSSYCRGFCLYVHSVKKFAMTQDIGSKLMFT